MAYAGTTAASSLANPPTLVFGALTRGSSLGPSPRGGPQIWSYYSADAVATVSASGYFSDAWYLGMRAGDVILGAYASSLGSTTFNHWQLMLQAVTTAGSVCSTGQQSTV